MKGACGEEMFKEQNNEWTKGTLGQANEESVKLRVRIKRQSWSDSLFMVLFLYSIPHISL